MIEGGVPRSDHFRFSDEVGSFLELSHASVGPLERIVSLAAPLSATPRGVSGEPRPAQASQCAKVHFPIPSTPRPQL